MDKRLILAVAGSGKTSYVIKQLNLEERFLVLTYTENNFHNIKNRVSKKFGCIPENIKIFTYFTFLYSFCFKPFLQRQLKVVGINFERCANRFASGKKRFIDSSGRVYSNRLVKLIETEGAMGHLESRLQKYFDMIIIDEVQDFAGHDFNLLSHFASLNKKNLFVGDFYQHTFDTSSDGQVNKNIHNEKASYIARFDKIGMFVDTNTLSHSYRCSPLICDYINKNLGIKIGSHRKNVTSIKFVESKDEIQTLFKNDKIVKLFYQGYQKYPCYSNNWGNSKGLNHYNDVCVILNPTTFKLFSTNKLLNLNSQTKNKLYVAITRTKGNLFFIEEKLLKKCCLS